MIPENIKNIPDNFNEMTEQQKADWCSWCGCEGGCNLCENFIKIKKFVYGGSEDHKIKCPRRLKWVVNDEVAPILNNGAFNYWTIVDKSYVDEYFTEYFFDCIDLDNGKAIVAVHNAIIENIDEISWQEIMKNESLDKFIAIERSTKHGGIISIYKLDSIVDPSLCAFKLFSFSNVIDEPMGDISASWIKDAQFPDIDVYMHDTAYEFYYGQDALDIWSYAHSLVFNKYLFYEGDDLTSHPMYSKYDFDGKQFMEKTCRFFSEDCLAINK